MLLNAVGEYWARIQYCSDWPHVHQHRYRLQQRACLVPTNTTKTYFMTVLKEHELYLTLFTFCNACSCSYCAWFISARYSSLCQF